MKNTKLIAILSLVLAVLMVMSACGTEPTATPDATNTPEATVQPTVDPTEEPTPTPTEEPTPTPVPTPEPTPVDMSKLVLVTDKVDIMNENTGTNSWQHSNKEGKDHLYTKIWTNSLSHNEQYDQDGGSWTDWKRIELFTHEWYMTEPVVLKALTAVDFMHTSSKGGIYNAPSYTPAVNNGDPEWAKRADPNEVLSWELYAIDAEGEQHLIYKNENETIVLDEELDAEGKLHSSLTVTFPGNNIEAVGFLMIVYSSPARNDEGFRVWRHEPLQLYAEPADAE